MLLLAFVQSGVIAQVASSDGKAAAFFRESLRRPGCRRQLIAEEFDFPFARLYARRVAWAIVRNLRALSKT